MGKEPRSILDSDCREYYICRHSSPDQHRIALSLCLQPFQGQPFEEFLFTQEISFHRGNQQGLAKEAGATEKIVLAPVRQPENLCGLVHAHVSSVADALEALYASRVFHKCSP